MLKIIMGTETVDQFKPDGYRFYLATSEVFDAWKQASWFEEDFVKRVIRGVDKAEVELGFSVRSLETGEGFSVNDLSGGAKYLILLYILRDKPILVKTTMGENCVPYLEELVALYESEGRDLIMVTNYFYWWNYNKLKSVYYVNWDLTCHSDAEARDKAFEHWWDYERAHSIDWRDEDDEDDDEEDEEASKRFVERLRRARDAKFKGLHDKYLRG